MDSLDIDNLDFYLTPEHDCSYLDDETAMTLFADPNRTIGTDLYSQLIKFGFRRSGEHVYRPRCPMCDSCIPIRVAAKHFQPNRSQRRNWKKNSDIEVQVVNREFKQEHYELYRRYISQRHGGSGMDEDDPVKYREFLLETAIDGDLHEFRHGEHLLGLAVVDKLENALSAVYTFFEPSEKCRALGVFGILHLLNFAKIHEFEHVYLGYWIPQCQKMAYKCHYKPYEVFNKGRWEIISS